MAAGIYISELKSAEWITRLRDEGGNTYGIAVIGPGQNLFFQMNERALICGIDAVHGVIYTRTIKEWDDRKRISPKARPAVAEKILQYYRLVYNPTAQLDDGRP
jgi:hypothetical protein